MKSLRVRLTVWFTLSLLGVMAVLVLSAHHHLDYELRKEKWERTDPAHPDWILHGSFTDQEVSDILGELMNFWALVGLPLAAGAVFVAYLLARQSLRPVEAVNQQLARLDAANLERRVRVPAGDPEFVELVRRLNELLDRLAVSFRSLQEYSAQVAHELRTPLQLMRLEIEAHAASMPPELAEGLADELARLSGVVEVALTIARAEQGRLEVTRETVALGPLLDDLLEPFGHLASAEGRRLLWSCPAGCAVATDRNALKQILINVVGNALRHGHGDLHLRIRVRQARVVLLLGNGGGALGPGAPGGLGIGLRLVRALVAQLGDVNLRIRRGRWYWVRLELPAG